MTERKTAQSSLGSLGTTSPFPPEFRQSYPACHDESKEIKTRTGYRRCDTMCTMKIPVTQAVGGIADCHAIIV